MTAIRSNFRLDEESLQELNTLAGFMKALQSEWKAKGAIELIEKIITRANQLIIVEKGEGN